MSDVRVGLLPPLPLLNLGDGELRRFLARVAELDIDHVAVGDHVSFVGGAGLDGLIFATRLAASEPRLPVYIAVYQLALRHPVVVARQISSFASIAPGRLIFGVGLGGEDPHELEICGVDPQTRGRRLNECLAVLRLLLEGAAVTFDGRFIQVRDAVVQPAPDPRIPIIVGGRSDHALRRAGRLGDGWIGIWNSPRRFATAVEIVAEAASKAGRSEVEFQHAMQVWCGLGSSHDAARPLLASAMEGFYGIPFESFEKYSPSGRPAEVAEFLAPYVEAGCRTFNLIPVSERVEESAEGVAEVRQLLLEAAVSTA